MTWAFDETPDHLVLAEQILAAQPFSVLLGTRITRFGGGVARLELPIRPELRQQHGYVHGGVLSYLADNALTFAAGTALGVKVLTAGFNLEYVRPATGILLVAEAEVVTVTARHAVVHCVIRTVDPTADAEPNDREATVVAVAQGSARTFAS